ncbi:MFS transporter [Billgrantia pellis]|uniref:MFS transporter n=1 Tax=Billgrantia pellis TaxID=2606936 RepID=A0A7V7FWY2_9GAMM|nr:MFS transporter [Halomonas pellis]KAA0010052.1 MFS transporter [Halomonas pellis]
MPKSPRLITPPDPSLTSRREIWIVVVSTTWVQALTSAAMLLVPVLAPQIAADFSIPTGLVGLQVSLLYGIAMLVSLQAGSLARRLGACRSSQVAMALVMVGCAVAGGSTPAALLLTTLLLGVAYGLTNPAAAQLLARYTPLRHRNLLYSIKQSGVPLGGVLSGSLAPSLAQAWSWHAAFFVLSLAALFTTLALQLRRREWDSDRAPATLLRGSGSLAVLYRRPPILWLGMAGFCLAAAQLSLLSFTVAFMVEELLITLITAGVIMSVVHASGVVGRVGWGMLADRLGRSVPVLCGLAIAMLVLFVAVSLLGPGTPVWLVIGLLSAAGVTAIGWNGVYLSEVARRSPQVEVSEATAAVLVLTYMGVLTGPALFSVIVSLGGNYSVGFLLPGLASLMALFCLRRAIRESETSPQSEASRSP